MFRLKITLLFVVIFAAKICLCDVHIYNEDFFLDTVLFKKEIFAKTTFIPANYTIIFQYEAPGYSHNIIFCRFNVTAKSTAEIVVVDLPELNTSRTVKAIINIFNARSFTVEALLKGRSYSFPGRHGRYRKKYFEPKSFTFIYEHNSRQTRNRRVYFGKRQTGDILLQKVSKKVMKTRRIAATDFLYENKQQSITSVDFSFDSPSANIFLNTSFIGEHTVNTVAYDLNIHEFTANMSIYGFKALDKPDNYQSIVIYSEYKNDNKRSYS